VAAGFVLAAWAELEGSRRGAPMLRHPLVFLGFLPYFIAGHLLATAPTLPRQRTLWAGAAVGMLATAVGCYMLSRARNIEAGLYFYAYLSLTVIPTSLAAAALLRSAPLPGTA
jgi:amino acid transporter